jgi:hypothetical protein
MTNLREKTLCSGWAGCSRKEVMETGPEESNRVGASSDLVRILHKGRRTIQ